MEFYSATKKRPIRLCETTRQFANESLNHKYGLECKKNRSIELPHRDDFESLSLLEKYDFAVKQIATDAPIRICENEKISGAATLGIAIEHALPATYNQQLLFGGISHLTINFENVLKLGIDGIEKQIDEKLITNKDGKFLKSLKNTIASFKIYHQRYLNALKNKKEYENNYANLLEVPFHPAQTFYQAVQSIWFVFAFTRLCGNWPGIGRIDYLLGNYLKHDLKENIITLDEAREILAHFFIKGCEWVCGGDYGSGDAQHYQNIVLAGVDENGQEVCNEVTYLVLDIFEELNIGDFPTTIRLNKNSPEKLLTRASDVIVHGGGIIAFYDEDVVIKALVDYGYDIKQARTFANDGCWEVQVPGKTYFTYKPFDGLQILQQKTLHQYQSFAGYPSYEKLYQQFLSDLNDHLKMLYSQVKSQIFCEENPFVWKESMPCSVVSLFEEGCIEKGLSYLEGGPKYNLYSFHIGGLSDVVNSLYIIKKIVFDEQKISFGDFMDVLKNNWENQEVLRQYIKNKYLLFGNDCDEVDDIYKDIIHEFSLMCNQFNHTCGYRFPAGISTFGRQIEWAPYRLATPFGKKSGEILAANASPTPGSDVEGVTAIIKSYCKANHSEMTSGSALDIKLLPSNLKGETGINVLKSLMKGFISLHGFFMQLDVCDSKILKLAQEKPDEYQTLSVRVSGWNARFVTLNRDWQDMIIKQVEGK